MPIRHSVIHKIDKKPDGSITPTNTPSAAQRGKDIDAVTPQIIAQYRDSRTAKVRANREISLLSHIYNIAREWGSLRTTRPPALSITWAYWSSG